MIFHDIDIHRQNVFCSHLLSLMCRPLLLSPFLFSTSPSSNFLFYFNFLFLIFSTCEQHIIEIIHRDMCKELFTRVWATCQFLYPEDKASSKEVPWRNDSHWKHYFLYQQLLTLNSCAGKEGPCEPPWCFVMEFGQAASCVVNHSHGDFQSTKATFFPGDRFMKASSHKNKVK